MNPDAFRDANCNIRNPWFYTMMAMLENTINVLTRRITNGENNELVEIFQLFYAQVVRLRVNVKLKSMSKTDKTISLKDR